MRADGCSVISDTVDGMPIVPVGQLSVLSNGRRYLDGIRVLVRLRRPRWTLMYVWITDSTMITRITRRKRVLRTRHDEDAGRERSGERQGFDDLGCLHLNFLSFLLFRSCIALPVRKFFDLPITRLYFCRDEPDLNGTF